jgi:hypothetical protein
MRLPIDEMEENQGLHSQGKYGSLFSKHRLLLHFQKLKHDG